MRGVGVASKLVQKEYEAILSAFGNELDVLSNVPQQDLLKVISAATAKGIMAAREGRVSIAPGYDGEYGKIKVSGAKEKFSLNSEQQLSLFF